MTDPCCCFSLMPEDIFQTKTEQGNLQKRKQNHRKTFRESEFTEQVTEEM